MRYACSAVANEPDDPLPDAILPRRQFVKMLVWVRNHRGKLLVACALVAGGYLGGRYLMSSKLIQWRERDRKRQVDISRLKELLDSNRQTCFTTVLGCLPNLREVIVHQLDAETITEQLRAKPVNKVALWENLKVIGFARLVSSVYACSLLSLLLRVQLSITGGQMYCEVHTQQRQSTEIHKQFLSHLLQDGLHNLISVVREAAHTILISYSLKHQLSCDGIVQLLSDIRQHLLQLSASSSQLKQHCFLVNYLLPKESQHELNEGDSCSQTQIAATRDILECSEFGEILEGCTNKAFTLLSHSLAEAFHSAAQSQPTLPLAKIIPLVCDHAHLILSGDAHFNVITRLVEDKQLQTLSQNIYEAFAHSEE